MGSHEMRMPQKVATMYPQNMEPKICMYACTRMHVHAHVHVQMYPQNMEAEDLHVCMYTAMCGNTQHNIIMKREGVDVGQPREGVNVGQLW